MSKIPLNKSIEATKLNERTEAPLVGPPVTIPFGGVVEPAGASRGMEKFRYLGELYSVARDTFVAATRSDEIASDSRSAPATPVGSEAVESVSQNTNGAKLRFEQLDAGRYAIARAKVQGGWLLASGAGIAFYPDPAHEWDGTSVE